VTETCGACHAGAARAYLEGSHARALARGDDAPGCADCHTAHSISERSGSLKDESDRLCGRCHQDRLERYLETYHGRAKDLGHDRVAACSDCHGHHAVHPSSDPRSTLAPENRLETCQKCHEGAPPKFAGFLAHADHGNRAEYPLLYWTFVAMTGLLLGTFAFFGIHTLLWLVRSGIEYRRDPQAFSEAKRRARDEKGSRLFVRFRPVDRFCHGLLVVSFLLLVATGMPLKFHHAAWAHAVFDAIGGVRVAGILHRIGAVMTLTYFVIHIVSMIGVLRRHRAEYTGPSGRIELRRLLAFAFGPDSPLPNPKDALDLRDQIRWFFGRGPQPKFDRFTYWEKFDYMAVFWGVSMIGVSGLVMWFPTLFTRILPGWTINVAHIIHSDEALLAAGFIFLFHFFHGHFRPDKFPIDLVMFSGRITEDEMRHERPRQYERLVKSGELEQWLARDDWPEWKSLFVVLGAVGLLIGVLLIAAVFATMVGIAGP
jgi:predicted CXXCH cytochrome family protein